jgi:hypothetical protein
LRIAQTGDHKFTTYFLGARGEVLARSGSLEARYEFRGGESYVRARVEASNGAIAWTQPAWRN